MHWNFISVTEYIGGGELHSLVERYGRCGLSERVVKIYVAEMALALGKYVSIKV